MILFFSKNIENCVNKGLQSFKKNRDSIIACKLKLLITFDSLIKMEWFKAFHVHITLEEQFQIFVFEKSVFFICSDYSAREKNNVLGQNFWLIFPNAIKFSAYERHSLSPPSIKVLA